MSSPTDSGRYLLGKIEAVELLASTLAAHLSPAIASVLLQQCEKLREKAKNGEELSPYELGFASVETKVLESLKLVAGAEKMRSLSPDDKH